VQRREGQFVLGAISTIAIASLSESVSLQIDRISFLGRKAGCMTLSEALQEQIERWRRMRIHLVKHAAAEWQERLDEETYGGKIKETKDLGDSKNA
jgi:hypothetical protein